MCKTLGVTRSGYHHYLKNRYRKRKLENKVILELIKQIWKNSHHLYGYRRIHAELHSQGLYCNRKRILRLMHQNNIAAKTKKKFKRTTNSNHSNYISPNLLEQNFRVNSSNEVWVADITYISTYEGWLYLSVVIDLYSRKVVGWSMSNRMTSQLVIDSLEYAIADRKPEVGLIFHSDRGSQYSSVEFRRSLKRNRIIQSMSGKGNCYDNAVAESFFHTLKTELVYWIRYKTRKEARSSIFAYIEGFYNRRRRHSYLNYFSPSNFEILYLKKVA
ncbi:MAG: IS3 family transposase [Chlorobi bacterium]|nr:IS3 family transposase [Chlorobiota bacterium]